MERFEASLSLDDEALAALAVLAVLAVLERLCSIGPGMDVVCALAAMAKASGMMCVSFMLGVSCSVGCVVFEEILVEAVVERRGRQCSCGECSLYGKAIPDMLLTIDRSQCCVLALLTKLHLHRVTVCLPLDVGRVSLGKAGELALRSPKQHAQFM